MRQKKPNDTPEVFGNYRLNDTKVKKFFLVVYFMSLNSFVFVAEDD